MMNSLLYKTSVKKDLIIQKSGKGNSVVIVDKQDYIKQMNNIFSYQKKFTMVIMNNNTLLNFAVNQEKSVDNVIEKLVKCSSMTEKNKKSLTSVGSRPGVMCSSCKAHKGSADNCLDFVRQLPTIAQICRL